MPTDLDVNLSLAVNSPTFSSRTPTIRYQEVYLELGHIWFQIRSFLKSHSGDVSADRRFQERNSSYCNNAAHFGKLSWHRAKRKAEGEAEDLQVGLWLKLLLTNCACVCLQPKCIHHTAAVCLPGSKARVFELRDEVLLATRRP